MGSKRTFRWMIAAVVLAAGIGGLAGFGGVRAAAGTTLYFPLSFSNAHAVQRIIPAPAGYEWRLFVQGLSSATALVNAGDGSGRLFVVERAGQIRIIQNGALLPTPYLNIDDRVGSAGGEQGLLGLAFDPNYSSNGRFYVNYTDTNGNTVISRFNRSGGNANLADKASEHVLLQQTQPEANHNGGDLAFGPDGYLYIALGDGGGGGDPDNNAQNLDTLLGKILRIDVSGSHYTSPASNPFNGANGREEIWAYGLRNPWRISFDRQTGELYIADVGQSMWEELDVQPAGSSGAVAGINYGWRYREGAHPYTGTPPAGLALTDPVFEYDHGKGCAITGGYVYRGTVMPEWQGIYLFADYCRGQVWAALSHSSGWEGSPLFNIGERIVAFGQDEAGELYLLDEAGQALKFMRK